MGTDFTIREAVPEDADAAIAYIVRLSEETEIHILLEPGEFGVTPEQEREFIERSRESDNALFLVAEAGGRIVGVLTCEGGRRRANRHVTKLGVTVDGDFRGEGIGTALLQRALDWARSGGVVRRIELGVFAENERAIRLYRRLGFEVEGRRRDAIYRGGCYHDDLDMALMI
jgi:RimJ/RimL family protein N-acetyltransferase